MEKGVSRNLEKKGEGRFISNMKRRLSKEGMQEEGEGMPDFFYCFEYKADIATL